jgi:hypothetical protein
MDMPAARRPRVTIVVPCHNYERYLTACVSSALDQPGVDANVVIVDDRSSDASLDLAHSLARGDARVEVIAHAENRGPVATFNDGLAIADGDYLVRLDADDLLIRGALARAVAVMEAEPTVGLVYGHPVHFTGDHPPVTSRGQVTGWTIWPGQTWLERRCRLGWNCITSPEVVMRAAVVDVVRGQREELPYAHDMEMWLRMAAVCDVAHIRGSDQAFHRDHDRSMTASSTKLMDLQDRRKVFETLFDGSGSLIADQARLRTLAQQALTIEALEEACRSYDRPQVSDPPEPYVTFALETYPEARSLRAWRAYEGRQRVGSRFAPYVPHFFAHAAARRVRSQLARRRWNRDGV